MAVDFRGVNLSGVNFANTDLSNAQFDQFTVFSSHDPGSGQSSAAYLGNTGQPGQHSFRQPDFRGVNLAGVNLSNANLSGAQFDHQTIFSESPDATFAANLSNSNGTGAILSGIAPNADLRGVNLAGVRLSTPGFHGLMDQTTVFSIPNPAGGGNIGAKSGSDANLANTPMGTVDFRGVNLSGVNLSNSDLSNAQFDQHTIFSTHDPGTGQSSAVNLLGTGANLSSIPSSTVDFRGVNLAGVNLSNATSAALNSTTRPSSPPPTGGGPNFAANLSNTNNTEQSFPTHPMQTFGRSASIDPRFPRAYGPNHGLLHSQPGRRGEYRGRVRSGASLANTPLGTVDFRGVNLSGVNLSNADLSNALFDQFTVFSTHDPGTGQSAAANLLGTGANLSNIPFVNVDFRGVNLAGVNLSNADLSNAQFDHQTIFSAPNPGGGRTSQPTCPIRMAREQSFPGGCGLRGVNLAGVRLSTNGFNGLMDQTTVFSIPNPAGGGNIGANLSGSEHLDQPAHGNRRTESTSGRK